MFRFEFRKTAVWKLFQLLRIFQIESLKKVSHVWNNGDLFQTITNSDNTHHVQRCFTSVIPQEQELWHLMCYDVLLVIFDVF
jgi:hypothetical protein